MAGSKDKDKDKDNQGQHNQAQLEALQKLSQQMDTLIKVQTQIRDILTNSNELMPPADYNISMVKGIKNLDTKVSSYIEKMINEKNRSVTLEKSYAYRKSVAKEWYKCLNTRKMAFYNKMRCEGIAEIYSSFLERDPIFIPHKFQEKAVPGESEEQKRLKLELSKCKMTVEIERLKEQAVKHDSIISENDRIAQDLIHKAEPEY